MLKVNDLVQLKSGGSKMIIVDIKDGQSAVCIWQDKNDSQCKEEYPLDALTSFTPTGGWVSGSASRRRKY